MSEAADRWYKVKSIADPSLVTLADESLRRAQNHLSGSTVRCGIMHGDFAPWNTRLNDKGQLFVFDWESALWEAPMSWDIFHFHRQTWRYLKKTKNQLKALRAAPLEWASFLLYMLDSICTSYESGGPTRQRYEGWISTLTQQLS